MLIFKDIFSGDEMFSDNYKYKLVDDVLYEVIGKYETRKDGEVVLAGSNPSAEEAEEAAESGSVSGVDIVLNHRLVETHFGAKKDYLTYLKGYMKNLTAKLVEKNTKPEELEAFKTNMAKVMKDLVARFSDLQFWTGENMDVDGMIALMEYRDIEGQSVPVMMFFKHGLEQEKF